MVDRYKRKKTGHKRKHCQHDMNEFANKRSRRIQDRSSTGDYDQLSNLSTAIRKRTRARQQDPSITTKVVAKKVLPVDTRLYVIGGRTGNNLVRNDVAMSKIDGDGHLSPFTPLTCLQELRHGASVVVVGGLVYVAGGETANRQVHSTLWRYTPETDSWQTLTGMAEPRSQFALVGLSDCVVAVGGITKLLNFGKAMVTTLASCERYNIEKDEWTPIACFPASVSCNPGCVSSDGNIYISGGIWPRGISSQVLFYDPEDQDWQDSKPLLNARANHVMVSWQDKLLVSGGSALTCGHWMNIRTTEVFDMSTQQWSMVASPLTRGRVQSSGIVYRDWVYIVGGFSNNSDGTQSTHNTVLYLDEAKARWIILPVTLPTPVVGTTACVIPSNSLTQTQLP